MTSFYLEKVSLRTLAATVHSCGAYGYGVYSYGVHSHGVYSYDLYRGMACIVVAYIVMAYIVMAYRVMAHIYIVMAHIYRPGVCSHSLFFYGHIAEAACSNCARPSCFHVRF